MVFLEFFLSDIYYWAELNVPVVVPPVEYFFVVFLFSLEHFYFDYLV